MTTTLGRWWKDISKTSSTRLWQFSTILFFLFFFSLYISSSNTKYKKLDSSRRRRSFRLEIRLEVIRRGGGAKVGCCTIFSDHILGALSVIYRAEISIRFVGGIESRVTSNCGIVGGNKWYREILSFEGGGGNPEEWS